jgi:hypothetical protein
MPAPGAVGAMRMHCCEQALQNGRDDEGDTGTFRGTHSRIWAEVIMPHSGGTECSAPVGSAAVADRTMQRGGAGSGI